MTRKRTKAPKPTEGVSSDFEPNDAQGEEEGTQQPAEALSGTTEEATTTEIPAGEHVPLVSGQGGRYVMRDGRRVLRTD